MKERRFISDIIKDIDDTVEVIKRCERAYEDDELCNKLEMFYGDGVYIIMKKHAAQLLVYTQELDEHYKD